MFDFLSEETQLILLVIAIAILFIVVMWNTKRNKQKLYNREQRQFRKNYLKKKKKRK